MSNIDKDKNGEYDNNNSHPIATNRNEEGSHLWSKGTCAIIGNSMLRGIGETCISSKRFRRFLGATVKDIHSYIIPLINR